MKYSNCIIAHSRESPNSNPALMTSSWRRAAHWKTTIRIESTGLRRCGKKKN